MFFLGIAGWIVAGFGAYQVFRICQGEAPWGGAPRVISLGEGCQDGRQNGGVRPRRPRVSALGRGGGAHWRGGLGGPAGYRFAAVAHGLPCAPPLTPARALSTYTFRLLAPLLLCAGQTTSESFKRRDYRRALALQRQADAQRAQQEAITERILAGGSAGGSGGGGGAEARHSKGASAPAAAAAAGPADGGDHGALVVPPNVYNRGAWRNLHEVLFPWRHLREAAQWPKED